MKYQEFKNRTRQFPVITSSLLQHLGQDERILRNQLSRWQKQNLLIKLRNGLYLLNRDDRAIQPSKFFLANQLTFPGYVSLESALAFYQIIPEAVYQVTSVTTAKPKHYNSHEGSFSFRHLKNTLYFGFAAMRDERGFEVFIAEPEKALLDFFYLNLARFSAGDQDIFVESYRFNGADILNPKKMMNYAMRFESKKMLKLARLFIDTLLPEKESA